MSKLKPLFSHWHVISRPLLLRQYYDYSLAPFYLLFLQGDKGGQPGLLPTASKYNQKVSPITPRR